MANEELKRDQNHVTVLGGVTDDSNQYVTMLRVDPTTKRLLVSATGSGAGSVTSVSVVSANGLAGTVATATTTPAITLSTTITGILKGNGTAISAVTVGSGLSFDGTTLSATGGSSGITIGTTTITSGTNTRILYNNAGVVGEYSVIPVALGGTNATSASITAFNNITGYTASGATGTTSTNLVFSTSPVLTTPTLGVAAATSINKVAITAPATSATLTIADGKTLTVSNSITLVGTDSTTMTFPSTSKTLMANDFTNSSGQLGVASGGTNVASFTAYAVICGGTTSTGALQSIAGLGSSGQVLTSNGAGALPTFQAVPSPTFIGCRITKSSSQTIDSTLAALTFDTEAYDTNTMHDNVTNNTRITFNTAGYYHISGAVTTDVNIGSRAQIKLNGTTVIYAIGAGNNGTSTQNGSPVTFEYNFAQNDYIELFGAFTSSQSTTSGVDGCFLSAYKIG